MKIKNLLVSTMVALGLFLTVGLSAEASMKDETDKVKLAVKYGCDYAYESYCGHSDEVEVLASNETELIYMYADKNGHYLLDPLAEFENIIFIELHDMPKFDGKLFTGKKFIGMFEDDTLWDLVGLKEVKY